jgi:alkanesulfonate monooxygenase SsuD/methylene tetrahydromethanopterin reductase-like flavin-dependent oxidoreductase (luciferase family)
MGRDPLRRHELTQEVMDVARRAWAHKPEDGPLEYQTTHDHGVMRGRIMPGPFRPAPLLARAGLSPTSWRLAGREGTPLFFGRVGLEGAAQAMAEYRAGLEESGLSDEQKAFCLSWSTMQKTVMVADTDEAAMAAMEAPLGNLQALSAKAFAAYGDAQRKAVTGVSGDDPAAFRKAFVEGATIIGSPDTFAGKLEDYARAGVEHVALHMNFGFMDPAISLKSLDLFVREVMPRFAAEPALAVA